MFIDARELDREAALRSDICIVGGGVAGITLARELSGTGLDVCLLESGGFEADGETQALYEGECVGHPYYPLDTARGRQFGGSSSRWLLEFGHGRIGGRLRPLSPIDFEKRDWVPHSGWPFGRDHLEPYYRRAQAICRSGPYDYSTAAWESAARRRLPLDDGLIETAIYQGVDRDTFCRHYRDELKAASNVRVVLHANALEVESGVGGASVRGVRAACLDGRRLRVAAHTVVVATGGIEAPRLLLLSNRHHAAGLGNQHDLVGRFFMEHPHLWSGYLWPAERRLFERTGLYAMHAVDGTPVIGQLGLSDAVLRRERLLNYAVVLKPGLARRSGPRQAVSHGFGAARAAAGALRAGEFDDFNRHLSTLFPVINNVSIGAYRKAMRVARHLFGRSGHDCFRLNHMAEQVPNPESRVTLDDAVDRFGQRRVRLDWRLTAQDIDSVRRAQQVIDGELRRTGLGRLQIELEDDTPPPDLHGGWHHMGTTRMHVNPKQGVVDADCRVHGIDNLYVAGPSVFPTGGCANPALTLIAMTVRLGDHLKRQLA